MLKSPPDILITTPESLFLMLTSRARETLRGVEVVIVDEVHAVAGSKRGAHLALSLERLERLVGEPVQRVGLSATQRPLEEIGRFVSGGRPIELVDAGTRKELDLRVVVPLEDMREPGEGGSIWPSIHPAAARARAGAPLHDRLRQQPPARRAPRAPPQRAGREGDRARPPRVARARAAGRGRGAAQEGRDPVPRGHLVARARDRHGRRRPRHPGRVAQVGRPGAPAGRAAPGTGWTRPRRAASSRSSGPTCSSPPSSRSA